MNNKGFTLVEIVLVIVITGILGGFMVSFLVDSSRMYQIMKVQSELYQDGLYIMERISRDIADSTGIDASCPDGFKKTHASRDSAVCTQYILTGRTLYRNGRPIGRNVITFNTNYATVPYTVAVILERECGMSPNKDGTQPKCRIDLSTSMLPMNTAAKFNGNYEETVY